MTGFVSSKERGHGWPWLARYKYGIVRYKQFMVYRSNHETGHGTGRQISHMGKLAMNAMSEFVWLDYVRFTVSF